MIAPSKRPECFSVAFDAAEPLWGVPGTMFEGGRITAHRTHLPLLDPGLVSQYLARNSLSVAAWQDRDTWCDGRFTLRTTQHQAIDFAIDRRGVLLFDEQRLGKTGSALMMDMQWRRNHKAKQPYGPMLIIAPLSTRAVWLSWIKRVYPGVEVGVITGRKYDRTVLTKPIVFGHYDVIHKWQSLIDIGTIIFDEVQYLTNPTSKRALAAVLLASKARHVVCCTGTPINKFPPDMWTVLNLAAPGAWGTYFEFAQRYGNPQPGSHGTTYEGISNEAELKARLDEIMIRRLWRDCYKDLPPISRSVVVADLTQAERNKLDILAGKLKSERSNTVSHLAAYRKLVFSIKLPTVIREATRVLDAGEPIVIWTWHKDSAEKLGAKLASNEVPVFVIHGDIVPVAERERRMDAWRESKAPAVLVANMAVAGAGIDLSHAKSCLFAELDWTPTTIGQAEMRTYDSRRPMDVAFVVANHLVEQRVVRSLISKLGAQDPLGVAAAIEAIDAIREAIMGPEEEGDLDRLLADLIASGS